MTGRLAIGAKSPGDSRIWRNLAHCCRSGNLGLARDSDSCNRLRAKAVPQKYSADVYHFRTPSPSGQQMSQDILLPTFFSRPVALIYRRRHAQKNGHEPIGAHCLSRHLERLFFSTVELRTSKHNKGTQSCLSNQSFSPLSHPSALLPAVTPLVSRPLLAVPSAASEQRLWVVTRLQVLPWVRAQTFCIATRTRASADTEQAATRGIEIAGTDRFCTRPACAFARSRSKKRPVEPAHGDSECERRGHPGTTSINGGNRPVAGLVGDYIAPRDFLQAAENVGTHLVAGNDTALPRRELLRKHCKAVGRRLCHPTGLPGALRRPRITSMSSGNERCRITGTRFNRLSNAKPMHRTAGFGAVTDLRNTHQDTDTTITRKPDV
jgi:hypothetical protein